MIKGLNNNKLELRPQCGRNCERMCSQSEGVLIMAKSPQLNPLEFEGVNDPKWSNSTTLRGGANSTPSEKVKGESV